MSNRGASVVGIAVKSLSVFPDLVPVEYEVFFPLQRRAKRALAKFGASCRESLASLPQCEICMLFAMILLASS